MVQLDLVVGLEQLHSDLTEKAHGVRGSQQQLKHQIFDLVRMFGKGKENPLPPTLANIDLILSHLQLKKREVPQHQHQHQRSHAHRNASHEVDRGYVA